VARGGSKGTGSARIIAAMLRDGGAYGDHLAV
jgi:hypothetical protein